MARANYMTLSCDRDLVPEMRLVSSIVLLSVYDWRKATKQLRKNPENIECIKMKKDAEIFFLSDWFSKLTELDGVSLLEKLQKELTEK